MTTFLSATDSSVIDNFYSSFGARSAPQRSAGPRGAWVRTPRRARPVVRWERHSWAPRWWWGGEQGADVGGRVTPGILRRVTASPIAATVVASLLGAPVELAVSHGGYAGAGARQFRSYILFRTHI